MSNASKVRSLADAPKCCPSTLSIPESTPLDAVKAKMGLVKGGRKKHAGDARDQYITSSEEGLASRRAAGTVGRAASNENFRTLLSTLPSLQPLLHKVVRLAQNDRALMESAVPTGTPLFEAFPPAVFFVGFESAGVYEAPFKLRYVLGTTQHAIA